MTVPDDPFLEVRQAIEAEDSEAKRLVLILDALKETIMESRHDSSEPSATEYVAAIMAALQGTDQSHTPQLVSLLALAMPSAHQGLLTGKYTSISKLLMKMLKDNGDEETGGSANILQRSLRCMGLLLAAQPRNPEAWASPSLLHCFQTLLRFFSDRRSKVRRAAHEAVATILAAHGSGSSLAGKKSGTMPAHQVCDFCRTVVSSCTSQDVTRALHLLQFMRLAVPLFSPPEASMLCDLMLRLLALGSPPLTAGVMKALSAVVQSPQPCLSGPFLAKLVNELLKLQPNRSAGAGAVSFAPLVGSCMVRLQVLEPRSSRKLLPQATHALVSYCESSSSAVHTSACGALNLAFQSCVDQPMIDEMAQSLAQRGQRGGDAAGLLATGMAAGTALGDTLVAMESLLQYRFQCSWARSLPLLGRLFLHLRGASFPILAGILRGLGELHDALSSVPSAAMPGVTLALNEAVGFAIEGMGPERVFAVLPLAIPPPPAPPRGVAGRPALGTPAGVAEARAWLLPLLAEHSRAAPTRLAWFQGNVLALAKECDGIARSGQLGVNEARTQGFRVEQLWALFPGFCARPTDIAGAFGALAPVLANAMQDSRYPGILPLVCAGLQVLVVGVQARLEGGGAQGSAMGGPGVVGSAAQADLQTLANTSTRFLPKLFEMVDPGAEAGARAGEGGQGAGKGALGPDRVSSVCDAAGALGSVAPPAFLATLFKRLLQKMLQ
ncbi:unnamed protein product, partial [Discosporangium mesarthrocarpum]